jgi:thioesterase domain-containing protein
MFHSVFTLQKGDGKIPLFFFPDLGGSVFYAKKLVAALDAKQPVYGFRLDSRTAWANFEIDIPSLAEKIADALIASDHTEPYHLIGHSFAGIMAFETARQLESKGAEVGILAILDAGVPLKYNKRSLLENLIYPFKLVFNILRYLSLREILEKTKSKYFGRTAQQSARPSDKTVLSSPGFATINLNNHPKSYRDIISHFYSALIRYEPNSYAGNMVIFKSKILGFGAVGTRYLGWQNFVNGKLEVHTIDGNHLDMVRKDVQTAEVSQILANKINQYLSEKKL